MGNIKIMDIHKFQPHPHKEALGNQLGQSLYDINFMCGQHIKQLDVINDTSISDGIFDKVGHRKKYVEFKLKQGTL